MAQELPVMEHFYTIQGEGVYSGWATYFVRLGGCDVGCVWCDVKESWPIDAHPLYKIEEIVEWVTSSGANIVVITGGEPAMHDLRALTELFRNNNIRTHIETSGAYPIFGDFDWITVSPKKFKAPVQDTLAIANELKVVVFNQSDFIWAEEHAKYVSKDCTLLLQPEWSKREKNQNLIIDYVKANQQWKISLQTHKYLEID